MNVFSVPLVYGQHGGGGSNPWGSTDGNLSKNNTIPSTLKLTSGVVSNFLLYWTAWLANKFASLLIWISGGFLWLGGQLLDYSIRSNVCDLAQYTRTDVVTQGWVIARNVANFFSIFILLYIAISIILGIGNDQKKLIVFVVIVALVINFSAVFTRFVIDVSNVFSHRFYTAIIGGSEPCSDGFNIAGSGVALEFMRALSLTDFAKEGTWTGNVGGGSTITPIVGGVDEVGGKFITGILSAVIMLVAAWSFIIVAVLMFIRTALLMLLIILSPIAFMGFILPPLKKTMESWWSALIGQSFFLPIYLFFVIISLVLMRGTSGVLESSTKNTGTSILVGSATKYVIYLTLIIFGLIQAKKMSEVGAEAVQKKVLGGLDWARGQATGAALRNTVGRAGHKLAENESVKLGAAKGNPVSLGLKALGDKASKAKYGSSSSYDERVKDAVERAKTISKPTDRAEVLTSPGVQAQNQHRESPTDRKRGEATEEPAKNNPLGNQLSNSTTNEQKKETGSEPEKTSRNKDNGVAGTAEGTETKGVAQKPAKSPDDDDGRGPQKTSETETNKEMEAMSNPKIKTLFGKSKQNEGGDDGASKSS